MKVGFLILFFFAVILFGISIVGAIFDTLLASVSVYAQLAIGVLITFGLLTWASKRQQKNGS